MNRRAARLVAFTALVLGGCVPVARPPIGVPAATQPGVDYAVVQGRDAAFVARLRAAPAPAQPEVEDGGAQSGDQSLLAAKGYVQIGIGHFRTREQAEQQGRAVGADRVLIYAGASDDARLMATYYVRLHLPFGANFRDLTEQERQELGTSGVEIGEVIGDTPAARANLREGDFVVKFNHASVRDKAAFQTLLQDSMGKRVTLTVRRGGAAFERSVRLGSLPEE